MVHGILVYVSSGFTVSTDSSASLVCPPATVYVPVHTQTQAHTHSVSEPFDNKLQVICPIACDYASVCFLKQGHSRK